MVAPDTTERTARPSALGRWFGFEDPVGRGFYAATGLGLGLIKYALEVALVYVSTGAFWSPLAYFNPVLTGRMEAIPGKPEWLLLLLAVLTLPFMWIAVSMSVRRAVDAGLTAWWGLLVLVPGINYVAMLTFAVLPPRGGGEWHPGLSSPYRQAPPASVPRFLEIDSAIKSALLGVVAATGLGLGMVGLSVYGLGLYGTALFFVTPFVMGTTSGFIFNYPHERTLGRTILVATVSTLVAGSALLLFALEGLICLAMAFPIAFVIAVLGSILGRAVALRTTTSLAQTAAMLVVLPGLAGAEAKLVEPPLHEVVTTMEVDAPPEAVWQNVIAFGDLEPPADWVFKTGIAFPMRARIEGSGPGAVRHCEFSTGAFVEPITTWDAPRRLGFDVASQPPAMKEWSPFRHVHPPHLDGSIRSKRGEFRLVSLPGGRTRLEGSTWYELPMYPEAYWKVWSDALLHRIHLRVLTHVKRLSEAPAR
jgi:hypothetical protein